MGVRSATQDRIIAAATALFTKPGYQKATIKTIAERSQAAVGSVQHFFADKAEIAAAVYIEVSDGLVATCKAALDNHASAVEEAVVAVQGSYIKWAGRFPNHLRLLRELEPAILRTPKSGVELVEDRLKGMMRAWAAPLIEAETIRRLSSAQLVALILAPVMLTPSLPSADRGAWPTLLARLAISALDPAPAEPQLAKARKRGTSSTQKQRTLF